MRRSGLRLHRGPALGRVAITLAGMVLLAASLMSAQGQPVPQYPDLETLPPSELYPDTMGFGPLQRHILRFTNIVVNVGDGPLELRGNPATGGLVQRLFDEGGGFVDRPLPGADFIFHADHNHWHLADFAAYELHRVGDPGADAGTREKRRSVSHHQIKRKHDGKHKKKHHRKRQQGHRQKRDSRKTSTWYAIDTGRSKASFCVRDTDRVWDEPWIPANPSYLDCEQDIQGLSVGWGDTYRFNIADQWIDLGQAPLPDGEYVLRSVADPRNLLDEGGNESEASNSAQTCFNVVAGQLKIAGC